MSFLIFILCVCSLAFSVVNFILIKDIYDYEMDYNTEFISYCKNKDEDDFLDFKER